MDPTFRVCIDARLGSQGASGGVEQFVVGLASGLAEVAQPGEEYLFLADPASARWLPGFLRGPCRLLAPRLGAETEEPAWKRAVKAAVPRRALEAPFRLAAAVRDRLPPRVPRSDGTVERAGAHVLHQAMQYGFETELPTVYVPHDVQHLHMPELFTARERMRRAAFYPQLAKRAAAVVALTRWGKEDLVRRLGLPAGKVFVIGHGPAIDAYGDLAPGDVARLRERLRLPDAFALFPAQAWPHKNHVGLLDALTLLRDRRGLRIPVVFTGHRIEHLAVVESRVRDLRLADQVRFTGFVSPVEMKALYGLARMLAFPSRFEGFGMPIVEAFRAAIPVACSDASCLPEIAGDAAVLFPPDDVEAMAIALERAWTDEVLRARLRARGLERARAFGWKESARRYRTLYRLAGSRPLDDEDRRLLAEMA